MEESRLGPVSISAYITGAAELAHRIYGVFGPRVEYSCSPFDSFSDVRCAALMGSIAVVWLSAFLLHAAMYVAWRQNRCPSWLERGLWMLLAIVGFPIGAVIYFFVIYRNLDADGQYSLQSRS